MTLIFWLNETVWNQGNMSWQLADVEGDRLMEREFNIDLTENKIRSTEK